MADKIATLLRAPQLAAVLGTNAYRTLTENFRWEDRVQDYIRVYERGHHASAVSSKFIGA